MEASRTPQFRRDVTALDASASGRRCRENNAVAIGKSKREEKQAKRRGLVSGVTEDAAEAAPVTVPVEVRLEHLGAYVDGE